MTSIVSLRTFANSSSVPLVVFVDMQQEYLAKPRLPAISEIDVALDMPADDIHRAVSRISGLYGEVHETTDWIASTLPRKLAYGKNAGG